MKLIVPLAAATIVASLALTGCSSGGLPGGIPGATGAGGTTTGGSGSSTTSGSGTSGSGSSGSGSSSSGSTTLFTGKDLTSILIKVALKNHDSNEIKGNAYAKSATKADTAPGANTSLTYQLTKDGGTLTPASCGDILDSLGFSVERKILQDGWEGAALTVGSDQLSIGSAPSVADAATVPDGGTSYLSQMASQCQHMSVSDGSNSFDFSVKLINLTTDADKTFAYEGIVKYGDGSTDDTATVEASYGNIFIDDIANTSDFSGLASDVNDVVEAAKG